MKVEILDQGIMGGYTAPDLTGVETDWSAFGTLDIGTFDIVFDDASDYPTDSFVVLDDALQPDAWGIKRLPDLRSGFSYESTPMVELYNLAAPDYTATIQVTPAMAVHMQRGQAVVGVARELHREHKRLGKDKMLKLEADSSLTQPAQPVMVPVLRLHCPKHTGCTANEEYGVQQGTTVDAELSLVALSGGTTTSTSLRWSSEWDAADGECLQYLMPAEIVTEHGTLLYDEKPIRVPGLFSLTMIRFVPGESRQEAIPETDDGCQQPAAAMPPDRQLTSPERIAAGGRNHTFNAVSSARGMLTLGVAKPGWPSNDIPIRTDGRRDLHPLR